MQLSKLSSPHWQQVYSKTPSTQKYDYMSNDILDNSEVCSEEAHSTTTIAPVLKMTRTKDHPAKRPANAIPRPASAPAELSPRAQTLILKHRASTLIQRHAGHRWREAQRTKWLLDIVFNIDQDYRHVMTDQATKITALQTQLKQTVNLHTTAAASLQAQNEQLRQRVTELEQQLRMSHGALLDMKNRVAASEVALQEAEDATQAAAEECHLLQHGVMVLVEQDAHARKLLSNRTHVMREALTASRSRVRVAAQNNERHRMEVAAMLSRERRKAEEERTSLTAQVESSLAAASTLLGTATRLEVDRLQLELEAYKEPWVYMARNKSPTRRKELTQQLGLTQKSFNVVVPF